MNMREELRAALERMTTERMQIDLDCFSVYSIFANLQLALRHPENNGTTSRICRQVALQLQDRLSEIYPVMAEIMKMGWDPNADDLNLEEYIQ